MRSARLRLDNRVIQNCLELFFVSSIIHEIAANCELRLVRTCLKMRTTAACYFARCTYRISVCPVPPPPGTRYNSHGSHKPYSGLNRVGPYKPYSGLNRVGPYKPYSGLNRDIIHHCLSIVLLYT